MDCKRKTGFIYPILAASALGHTEIVKLLLVEERNRNTAPMYKSNFMPRSLNLSHSRVKKFQLKEHGSYTSNSSQCQINVECPLLYQALKKQKIKKQKTESAKVLTDKNGMTAMHWAAKEGYLDIVKLLHFYYGLYNQLSLD